MSLLDALNGSAYNPLLGLAAGLMAGSGPSRMPVSFGQALMQGLGTEQQFNQAGIQNQMQRMMLPIQQAKVNWITNQDQPQNGVSTPPQAPAGPIPQQTFSGAGIPGAPSTFQGAANVQPTNVPLPSVAQMPQSPQGQPSIYDDPTYQSLLQGVKLGMIPPAAAQQRLDLLENQTKQMTPDQIKQYYPGGIPTGYTATINGLGKPTLSGVDPYHQLSVMDPVTGMMVPTLVDTRNPSAIAATKPNMGQVQQNLGNLAHMISTYQLKPSSYLLRSPQGQVVMGMVARENPNYDEKLYDQYHTAYQYWNTGKGGQQVASANKAVMHLDTLAKLAGTLDNTSTPLFNKMANYYKQQTGQAAPNNFNAAKQIAMNEVTKFIVGAGGSSDDRSKAQGVISAASSPAQLSQAIQTVKELMGGQLLALKKQYTEGTGRNDFENHLFPGTDQLVKSLETSQAATPAASKPLVYDPATGKFQ